MTILVIGGTGNVGVPLVAELRRRGAAVRVLTRSPERAAALPAGVEPFLGDIVGDPQAAGPAFAGVDAVFMLNAASPQETAEGLLAVELARDAGVSRFVYQSVYGVEDLAHLPHVAPKLVVQRAVMRSGMDYTLLCPNHFYQNDEAGRMPLVTMNLYVDPIGSVGCSRVDARDIAEAAAIALTTPGHGGQSYNLVGPEKLTGEDCAAIWGRALGRPIHYVGAIEAWQNGAKPFVPAWLLYDLSKMYEWIAAHGMVADAADADRLETMFGRPPRSFRAYAEERAAAWTS